MKMNHMTSIVILSMALCSVPAWAANSGKTASAGKASGPSVIHMDQDAPGFVKDIGRLCLTEPKSRIDISGNDLKITDKSAACTAKLKEWSALWTSESAPMLAAVNVKPGKEKAVEAKVKAKYQDEVSVQTVDGCSCLILQGTRAKEAAQFAMLP